MAAHRELESLCLDRQTRYHKDILSITYAQLVYDGHWFTPLREALDAFFAKTQEVVTGSVTLRLYKGNLTVKSRTSPYSLYRAGHRVVRYRQLQSARRRRIHQSPRTACGRSIQAVSREV